MLLKTFFLFLIVFLGLGGVSGNRVRRHLVFTEGSRLFFSVDVRDNLFDYSNFFAQVFGVKMDWFLPSSTAYAAKKGRIQRRDLYQGMEQILRRQSLNETACIRKFICEASTILSRSKNFLAQLYEIIFSASDRELLHEYKIGDLGKQCIETSNNTRNKCSLSLASILSQSHSDFTILVN